MPTTTTKKSAKRAVKRPSATKRTPVARRSDAIAILKQDHREVNALFKEFERAGDGAKQKKAKIVGSIIEALSRHAAIEELVFYPAVRREVKGSTPDVLEALEEHHVAKWLLSELDGRDPADERFDAKVTVLIENVRHHVREEENELFPHVRGKLSRARLLELGDELRAAKPRVPTHPHPRSPDAPPANAIVGSAVAVVDKARIAGKKAVERVKEEFPTLT